MIHYDLVGEEQIFVCTGIFVGCNESNTRILTSASLVKISDDENKINDNLEGWYCIVLIELIHLRYL